jgi:hypothetical protein
MEDLFMKIWLGGFIVFSIVWFLNLIFNGSGRRGGGNSGSGGSGCGSSCGGCGGGG